MRQAVAPPRMDIEMRLNFALALFMTVAAGSPTVGAVSSIKDAVALNRALVSARGGETLALRPGDFGILTIAGRRFAKPVVITSADPSRPATLSGLRLSSSAEIEFRNLEFSAPAAPAAADLQTAGRENVFSVLSSDTISFVRISAHGPGDGTLATEKSGFLIRNSSHVMVRDSEFRHFHNAIGHLDDDHLTITGNWFHDLRDDGIRGGGSSFVTISRNRFDSMHPDADDVDHPDCIQFWTTNTKASAHDIVIVDNLYTRGSGRSVQGVFLGNEASIPYQTVTITGNIFAGTGYNGIVVKFVKGLVITNNVVARYPDQTSRIRVIQGLDVVVNDNRAAEFGWTDDGRVPESNSRIERRRNQTIGAVGDQGRTLAAEWSTKAKPESLAGVER